MKLNSEIRWNLPLTDIFKRIATASESFMKWLGEHEHLSVKLFK